MPPVTKYNYTSPAEAAHHPGKRILGRHATTGLPIRGTYDPLLRGDAYENMPVERDYYARMFRMWIKEELDEYLDVMNRIAAGMFRQVIRREIEVPNVRVADVDEGPHMQIWLEWMQLYMSVDGVRDTVS